MLNILSAIALENGRDKSDEMHGIRLGNFKEFVMVWAFNTNPQYDSTVKFLTSSLTRAYKATDYLLKKIKQVELKAVA